MTFVHSTEKLRSFAAKVQFCGSSDSYLTQRGKQFQATVMFGLSPSGSHHCEAGAISFAIMLLEPFFAKKCHTKIKSTLRAFICVLRSHHG